MENWKERFEYIYVIEENKGEKYLRKYDHTTIVEELEYFISQELSKAREEGRREGSEITSRYISDFVKSESGKSGRKEILEYIEELSKLKQ